VGARAKGRNFVFFVHGYNNDVGDVLDRAERLEKNFGVEVLAFTWPANGGGVRGVASYKSDQRDALASTGALDRCFDHLNRALQAIHDEHVQHIQQEADARFPNDSEKWNQFFTTQSLRWCPFTVNMLLHSMGNYLLKHTLKSSSYRGDTVIFDNVIMAAADTNNEGHAEWVDRIQCRKRIFVTINENDGALRASRMKAGEQQKARLGHYPYELNAARAVYADFTNAPHVGSEHAYFEDKALDNPGVQRFFDEALNGGTPETKLRYDVARNLHRI
jgi:esterase/lipase superfamily enzyme